MVLVDTSTFARSQQLDSSRRAVCAEVIRRLSDSGEGVICAQVLIEFWSVASRPLDVNGLGMAPQQVEANVSDMMVMFSVLPEPSDMAARWFELVRAHSVRGRQVHDARLAAFMLAHGIAHIVTTNEDDFRR